VVCAGNASGEAIRFVAGARPSSDENLTRSGGQYDYFETIDYEQIFLCSLFYLESGVDIV
jgi:hypothetical protein